MSTREYSDLYVNPVSHQELEIQRSKLLSYWAYRVNMFIHFLFWFFQQLSIQH